MKLTALPYLLLLISALTGCLPDSDSNLAINFCESFEADDNCTDSDNTFKIGSPVYVHFTSDTPFEERTIFGRIIRILDNGERYELGVKEFDVEPETTYLTQSIPFQNFGQNALGKFLVQFSGESGQVMAERELIIIE